MACGRGFDSPRIHHSIGCLAPQCQATHTPKSSGNAALCLCGPDLEPGDVWGRIAAMKPAHITLRQFRYFIAVAESGSLAAASRMLSIAQSALTKAMGELEGELGSRLFE